MDIPTYVYNILNSVKIGQISPEVHTDFTQRLTDPAYLDALICILCNPNEDPTIRTISGHSLKSNLQGINDPQSVCVRITACLTEENPTVRKALYSVYSTGFAKWGWCDALLFIQNSFSGTSTASYGLELLSLIAEDLTTESAQFLADPSRSNTLEGIIFSLLGYIRCGELLAVTCYTRLLSVRLP